MIRSCMCHSQATIHVGICTPHPTTLNPPPSCQSTEVIMAQKYRCLCSKCDMGQKVISKHTIEAHLLKENEFLETLLPGTDTALFVKSCIDWMCIFPSQLHGGTKVLNTALDADGSRRCVLEVLTQLLLLIISKPMQHLIMGIIGITHFTPTPEFLNTFFMIKRVL